MLVFTAIVGLIFGSFCNVLIARLPYGVSILWPPSSCCHCSRRIRFYENIPLLSYIFLRGRCFGCGAKIGIIYPLVEIICAGIFVAVFYFSDYQFDALNFTFSDIELLDTLLMGVFFCLLFSLCLIDLRHFAVPEFTLLLTLSMAIYLRYEHIAQALICMGFVVIFKAVCELILNLLRPEFEHLDEHSKPLYLDSSSLALFAAFLLLGLFLYFGGFFPLLASLQIIACAYLGFSLIFCLLNALFRLLKLQRKVKPKKHFVHKEILGAADIEMIGILALFLPSIFALIAAVFYSAILMLIFYAAQKIFKFSLQKADSRISFLKESNNLDLNSVPASALPFFPFLALAMQFVLAFPQSAEVFGV